MHVVKATVFPVVMYECESWMIKKDGHWRTDAFEFWCSRLLDCKEIKWINPKENKSWIFIGRTGAEAETPILWPSDVKNWLIEEDPDAGNDWRQEEKGTTEDEMVGCITDSMDMSLSKIWELVTDREAWVSGKPDTQTDRCASVHGVPKSQTQLSNWTELNWKEINPEFLLEGLMLKFCYFGHLIKSWLIGRDPDAGKDWGLKEKAIADDEMIE